MLQNIEETSTVCVAFDDMTDEDRVDRNGHTMHVVKSFKAKDHETAFAIFDDWMESRRCHVEEDW